MQHEQFEHQNVANVMANESLAPQCCKYRRKGGFQIQNDATSRKRRQTSPNPLWHGGGNVMVQISMAGGTAGLGATSEDDVLQLEIRHEDVSCPMRSLVFTSLCQQWALQWGTRGSFYFEQPPSSSWAWFSSLEHVCQLQIGKRITIPLDTAMIEIIVVRLELAKLWCK